MAREMTNNPDQSITALFEDAARVNRLWGEYVKRASIDLPIEGENKIIVHVETILALTRKLEDLEGDNEVLFKIMDELDDQPISDENHKHIPAWEQVKRLKQKVEELEKGPMASLNDSVQHRVEECREAERCHEMSNDEMIILHMWEWMVSNDAQRTDLSEQVRELIILNKGTASRNVKIKQRCDASEQRLREVEEELFEARQAILREGTRANAMQNTNNDLLNETLRLQADNSELKMQIRGSVRITDT